MTVTKDVGPDGATVSKDDIEAKLREIRGEVDEVGEAGRSYAVVVAIGAAVAVIALAYLLGKRAVKKRTTVVEVRRV